MREVDPLLDPLGDVPQHIVARDDSDGRVPQSCVLEDFATVGSARRRIQPSRVGDDPQALLPHEDRRQPLDQLGKVGDIPRPRILGPEMTQDRHGQLGEVFERQDVDPAVASQQVGRIEVITPEAGAVADGESSACLSWAPNRGHRLDPPRWSRVDLQPARDQT